MKVRTSPGLAYSWAVLAATLQLSALALLMLSILSPVELPTVLELTPGTPVAFVAFLAYPIVGGLIAGRRPNNPVGWLLLLFSIGIALVNATYLYAVYGLLVSSAPLPGANMAPWLDAWLWIAALSPLPAVLMLYPTGRPLSRLWRGPIALCLLPTALAGGIGLALWGQPGHRLLLGSRLPSGTARGLEAAAISVLFGLILIGVAALVLRFRTGRWEQRQQIKWVALGSTYLLLSGLVTTGLPNLLPPLVEEFASIVGFISVPLAVAIAILKYRLYDIDRIINRTLVYGVVTAILGGTYVLVVTLAGTIVRGSALVTAAATLSVAALFQPLRRRIQSFIDRRFYRRKYDAARTVEAFSTRLRDEVDLEAMRVHLLAAVRETVQPRRVSVWLKG